MDSATRQDCRIFVIRSKKRNIEAPYFENSMVDELNDFADLFENPSDPEQMKHYQAWLALSRDVNTVMFDLRQSADYTFPADMNR